MGEVYRAKEEGRGGLSTHGGKVEEGLAERRRSDEVAAGSGLGRPLSRTLYSMTTSERGEA